jgi:hypothetical protein
MLKLKTILALSSAAGALSGAAQAALPTRDCIACGMRSGAPAPLSEPNRELADVSVAISELVSLKQSPVEYGSSAPQPATAPTWAGSVKSDWSTSYHGGLPGGFVRSWDVPMKAFDPTFKTAHWSESGGFNSGMYDLMARYYAPAYARLAYNAGFQFMGNPIPALPAAPMSPSLLPPI